MMSAPAARVLTPSQEQAIRTAMQTFVEEDLSYGEERRGRAWCKRCRALRPRAGFIAYDAGGLCNPCATEYELAHTRGSVQTVAEFLN